MRRITAFVLFALALGLVVLSYGPLRNLWSEYQDSPGSVYIGVAAIDWALAIGIAALGVWMLRHDRRNRR